MPRVKCFFYLSGNSAIQNQYSFNISIRQIGLFGSLYSESLILSTGKHFELYSKTKRGGIWSLSTKMRRTIGVYSFLLNKVKSPAVSGSIGEAVIIPALVSCMGISGNKFGFQRLKSRSKCPDFLIQTMPEYEILWKLPSGMIKNFPPDMPLEVKTRLSPDSNYPKTALTQLQTYWNECKTVSPIRDGFGIIARVNVGTPDISIRFYLFEK
ncbi:hypothetical protein REC12_00085 [Desulfosporosinus sp. PR]|uniref:hypothetical protein n=1 Tax=Candidatus Desulfosporosinus nitrosoreducens TaxID=3401928 RepID=UPI0027F9AAA8|nr:hypothetical protein [Desulfosporosinus sp. PR]MDQ7091993.1 hypothetical protein [Desulfosporosinus sp. PR]